MLPWIAQNQGPVSVRLARADDRSGIGRLMEAGPHVHHHPRLRPVLDWVGQAVGVVAEIGQELVGCLITPADPPPAAWIRAAGVARGYSPSPLLRPMLDTCSKVLAQQGVSTLSAMSAECWLTDILVAAGFGVVEEVETWSLSAAKIAPPGVQDLTVRPARPGDVGALAQIEESAFHPRWRFSEATLVEAHKQADIFTIAMRQGEPVAYQFSFLIGERIHLARITVAHGAQGSGVGSLLLADLLRRGRDMGLDEVTLNTQADNAASHRLYRRFGFRCIGHRIPIWERPL